MSNSTPPAASGGIGLGGALLVLFVGLKLTGYITWPWLWVLAPLWVPVLILLAVVLIVLIVVASASGNPFQ